MTPEEIAAYRQRWLERAELRKKLIEKICGLLHSNLAETQEYKLLQQQLLDSEPEYCEHGRHKYSTHCIGCDEDFKEAFPEYFAECQSCHELVDPDELNENKNCLDCQGS